VGEIKQQKVKVICQQCGKKFDPKKGSAGKYCCLDCVYRSMRNMPAHNRKDLSGMRFGRLIVIKEFEQRIKKKVVWLCKCDCGNYTKAIGRELIRGHKKSCGCLRKENLEKIGRSTPTAKHIKKGEIFSNLTVIRELNERGKGGHILYEVKCKCGNNSIVTGGNLRNGNVKSCGCLKTKPSKRRHELKGKKIGRLKVLKYHKDPYDRNKSGWICKCDCGNIKIYSSSALLSGCIFSCGCYFRENIRKFPDEDYKLTQGKRVCKNLSEGYLVSLMTNHNPNINAKDITPKMIDLKRQQIKTYRIERRMTNELIRQYG